MNTWHKIYLFLLPVIVLTNCKPENLGTIPVMNMETISVPTSLNLDHILFESEDVGFCASSDSNILFHTQDGGNSWNTIPTAGNIHRIFKNELGDVFIDQGSIYRTDFNGAPPVKIAFGGEAEGCTADGSIFVLDYHWGNLNCTIHDPKTGDEIHHQTLRSFVGTNIMVENNCVIFWDEFDYWIDIYNVDSNKVHSRGIEAQYLNNIFIDMHDTLVTSVNSIQQIRPYHYEDNNTYWSKEGYSWEYDFKGIHGKDDLFATVGKGCVVTNFYTKEGDWTTLVNDDFEPFAHQLLNVQVINSGLIYTVGENGIFLKCKI